jgi:4'-phosphopantetheinyl transferase
LANSGDFAAYAFTSGCEIGVDIEQHRALRDFENIARRFFSPEEAAELLELSPTEITAGFFNCWTRKEAFIKALGGGLSIPLDSFRVTLRPGADARMISPPGWTLYAFTPAPDYAGAIAYPGELRSIQAVSLLSLDDLPT